MHDEIQNELDNNVASTSFENQDSVEIPVTQFDESGEAGVGDSSDSQASAEDGVPEASTEEGETAVLTASEPPVNDEEKALEILQQVEIEIDINMNAGNEKATAWGCDLSYEYVKINGEYRS